MWGTAAATAVEIEGRRALRLPCNFKGTRIERASWDREVKLDLTACRGLQFAFFCPDSSPVAGFSFYLRSGGGWYAASFGHGAPGAWATVKIERTDTRMEETPAGWGSIDTLRISAWRGRDADTEFCIANLGLLGADAPIAILRGESVAKSAPYEAQSVAQFTKAVADTLDRLGLPYTVLSDLDATPGRLKGKRLAILPHNPQMPDAVADALVELLKGGGKLVAFYCLHPKLAEAIGVAGGAHLPQKRRGHFAVIRATGSVLSGLPQATKQRSWNIRQSRPVEGRSRIAAEWLDDQGEPTGEAAIVVSDTGIFMTHVLLGDDLANDDRLLLALLGHFAPELWEQVANAAIQQIGKFGSFSGFDDVEEWVRREAQFRPEALDRFVQARASFIAEALPPSLTDLRTKKADFDIADILLQCARSFRKLAKERAEARNFTESIKFAAEAQKEMLELYCMGQKPLKGEHRAWWCHSAFGPAGMTWDESIKVLADSGFTAIIPNMLWGGLAYYESQVLPVAPEVKEKGDQIALCAAACRKHGVQCHVWKVNWNMGGRAPKDFAERMKREGRTQVRLDGTPEDQWLCPSHPDNQKLEVDSMVEVATKYDVDGIHFDYIRYPGPEGCFCPGCRERFEKLLGAKVANWPADTRRDEAVRQRWLDFRRDNITRVVAATSDLARKARPNIKISAAVFPRWAVDRDGVGQDWKLWCERGYLDFVCPMDYTPDNTQFENLVRQQLDWAGKVPCYPGIGLSTWGPGDSIVRLIEQIGITRKLGTRGFTIFEYQAPQAAETAPLCGAGLTRKE